MPTYRLDQLPGNIIRLPSGDWRWYVIRLNSLPENVCEVQHLIFANEANPGDIMHVRIPPDLEQVDDDTLVRFGSYPDDRSFRTERGRFTLRPPDEGDAEPMWRVRPEQGLPFQTDVAIEKPLGHLSVADLQEIASVM